MNKKDRYALLSGFYVLSLVALVLLTFGIASFLGNPTIGFRLLTLLISALFLVAGWHVVFVNLFLCQTRSGAKGTDGGDYQIKFWQLFLFCSFIISLPTNVWSLFLDDLHQTQIVSWNYLVHVVIYLFFSLVVALLAKLGNSKNKLLGTVVKCFNLMLILSSGLVLDRWYTAFVELFR
jgi:hypothetical protein